MSRFLPCLLFAAASAFSLRKDGGYTLLVVHNDCWGSYFQDFDWVFKAGTLLTEGSPLRVCAVDSAVKALGMGIVAGAAVVNALQVRKLHLAGNAEGMSLLGQYSSALSNILMSVWWAWDGAPLTAWAECLIQAAGALAVAALMWGFTPPSAAHKAAAVATLAASVALFWGKGRLVAALAGALFGGGEAAAANALSLSLYVASNVAFWWARASQLYATWAAGGDESQFVVALAANALGSLVRVTTSSKEAKAPAEVLPYIMYIMYFNASLNVALLAQWLYFGGKKGGGKAGAAAPPPAKAARGGGASSDGEAANERPPSRSASVKAAAAIAEQARSPAKAAPAARSRRPRHAP